MCIMKKRQNGILLKRKHIIGFSQNQKICGQMKYQNWLILFQIKIGQILGLSEKLQEKFATKMQGENQENSMLTADEINNQENGDLHMNFFKYEIIIRKKILYLSIYQLKN